jgi:hypothetical protein
VAGPLGGGFQLGRRVVVAAGGGAGQMPGTAADRGGPGIGRLGVGRPAVGEGVGERSVGGLPVGERRVMVDGGADEGMPEDDRLLGDGDQARLLGRGEGAGLDAE